MSFVGRVKGFVDDLHDLALLEANDSASHFKRIVFGVGYF